MLTPRNPSSRKRRVDSFLPAALPTAFACVVLFFLPGCSRGEFRDRTAVVTIDGTSTTFGVDACGLDGTTAFVVGRSETGDVLQAVVEVEKSDHETGVPDFTGVMLSKTDTDRAAFGGGSWTARKGVGDPPGEIASARIRGSRIQARGRLQALTTPDGPPDETGALSPFSFDARCDAP